MRYIYTLFDYSTPSPRPLQSIVVTNQEISFFTFYFPKTGLRIKEIWTSEAEFAALFDQPICINDFKSHVSAFKLPKHVNYDVHDMGVFKLNVLPPDEIAGKKHLARAVSELIGVAGDNPEKWRRLLANASVVYQFLEERGAMHGIKRVPTIYSPEYTFTGRSKTVGFNIQGTSEDFDIHSINEMYNTFIHIDWIAADLRMAAFISKDPVMNEDFIQSDPYSKLAQRMSSLNLEREDCKNKFLRAIYSLAIEDPILDAYPTFQKWATQKIFEMRRDGYLTSLLGRKFYIDEKQDRTELSVFNSQFQGSVAHAMQSILVKLFDSFQDLILTEVHDSLILCCPEKIALAVEKDVVNIMVDPLRGWVSPSPRMPVRASVGNKWKQWERKRVYR